MITIDPITGRQIDSICMNLMRQSHRLHRLECPGSWHGAGAIAVGLKGSVQESAVRALLEGLSPNRKVQLAFDASDPARHGGWLLRFHSSPTLNALHAIAPTGFARAIEIVHDKAVNTTLTVMEKQIDAKKGASMVFARFQHRVGEGQTPNLHTLVVAPRLGFLSNGHVHTISTKSVQLSLKVADEVYLRTFTNQLEQLGLQTIVKSQTFRVVGVPDRAARELEQTFGGNRGHEFHTVKSWHSLSGVSRSELRDQWNDIGRKVGWTTEQAKDLVDYARSQSRMTQGKTQSQSHEQSR